MRFRSRREVRASNDHMHANHTRGGGGGKAARFEPTRAERSLDCVTEEVGEGVWGAFLSLINPPVSVDVKRHVTTKGLLLLLSAVAVSGN